MDLNMLIVGGGIHGAGLLHDLATRHVKGIHLVEQNRLASGTSSRTTKLAHGGLRYLEHPSQWGLVRHIKGVRLLFEQLGSLPRAALKHSPSPRVPRRVLRTSVGLLAFRAQTRHHE